MYLSLLSHLQSQTQMLLSRCKIPNYFVNFCRVLHRKLKRDFLEEEIIFRKYKKDSRQMAVRVTTFPKKKILEIVPVVLWTNCKILGTSFANISTPRITVSFASQLSAAEWKTMSEKKFLWKKCVKDYLPLQKQLYLSWVYDFNLFFFGS